MAPTIASFSTDSGVVGDHITNDNTLTLTGTAEANSTVKVYDGTTLLGSITASGSGAWSYTTAALADGAHSLSATDTDAAGNTSAASTLSLTIDTIAPKTPVATSTMNMPGFMYLTGTSEANSTVSIFNGSDGTLLGTAQTGSNGTWTFLKIGVTAPTLTMTATDLAGNTSQTPNVYQQTNDFIDLWTFGLAEDHTAGVDAKTLNQIESTTLSDIIARDTFVSYDRHSGTAGGVASEDPAAPQLIIGSNGTDKLVGGPNADVLVAGTGKQTMTGMGGADTFVIGQNHINATITDFTLGADKLAFDNPGTLGNQNVQIRQEHSNTVVTVGHDHVVLTDVDLHQLHPHDLSNLLV